MNRGNNKQGFTLVELMLAMGFVSALLLAIAMTVIQIGNIYNRGITYKSVNQAGTMLASELQRGINSSSPFDPDSTKYYVPEDWGGRLCIGQYSYIWNFGNAIQANDTTKLNVYSNAPDPNTQINFVKVQDSSKSYCIDATTTKKDVNFADAVELLDAGQTELAIHSFTIASAPPDGSTGQRLYNISYLIGTNDQTTLSGSSDATTCLTANNVKADSNYCAINQFDIVARAGNKAAE
ncbi:MAG: prepilin-type N-terminal cleavage/methylation domain-containing protein [Candidatus Saccharibacteria bacterium]|nr:prepilin-type N-terminal cleavage/methylation domain-containing protein [Candidatus Saccharibacteria bacterium]